MWSILGRMTALTLDQMLETEALLYQVARTGMDDYLKQDLTQVVFDSDGSQTARTQALLRPMMLRDDHCRSAQGMLCRAIRQGLTELAGSPRMFFGSAGVIHSSSADAAEGIARRLHMTVDTVRAYLDDRPGHAWEMVAPCTTADRLIVIGFTAMVLRKVVARDITVDPVDGSAYSALSVCEFERDESDQ